MGQPDAPPKPEFDSLKRLLLDMARERSVERLLQLTVRRLSERPQLGLVRIWLMSTACECRTCPPTPPPGAEPPRGRALVPGLTEEECHDPEGPALHLAASAGRPHADAEADWTRLDGEFHKFAIGERKVGRVASTRDAVIVRDIEEDASWFADPEWARREGIKGFCGQPLMHKGEVLGVMAVFTRIPVPDDGVLWLRILADHLAAAIANARAFEEIECLRRHLELECAYLREEVREAQAFGDIVGESEAIRALERQIELVAPTDASVLILGESGTGKELVAREMHRRSRRAERPLVRVNCASIPRELYESEFFGHAQGAFTGAVTERAGRFELADGGTLFLDEVGEIPLELQSKLLRVLQEGQYERLGEETTRQVDVRIVAATNRNLKAEVEAGRFRQDLYYRLNVFPLEVSPLRDRREDVALLAEHFVEETARKLKRPQPRLTQANIVDLQAYPWPGNVRELQNVIERAVITSRAGELRFDLGDAPVAPPSLSSSSGSDPRRIVPEHEMRLRERENLEAALEAANWKVYGAGGAAQLLGIKPTTLASRMKKMGLRRG